jgi:hypothetical protein
MGKEFNMPAETASAGCDPGEEWPAEERATETGSGAGGGNAVATCSLAGLALLLGIYGKLETKKKEGSYEGRNQVHRICFDPWNCGDSGGADARGEPACAVHS